jgi:class 3 adenylate cyclase
VRDWTPGYDRRMITRMRAAVPTGTVTFLFTDVEGSSKLLHELGAEAALAR